MTNFQSYPEDTLLGHKTERDKELMEKHLAEYYINKYYSMPGNIKELVTKYGNKKFTLHIFEKYRFYKKYNTEFTRVTNY